MFENTTVLLFLGIIGLIVGGEFFVKGASRLAKALGIPSVVIGLTVVALGTSMPEMAVSLKAAFDGNANIAVANVVGSNTFNILFILGTSALVTPLLIHSQIIKREVPLMIVISILLYLFAWDNHLARWEGITLVALGLLYTFWLVRDSLKNRNENLKLIIESESNFKLNKNKKISFLISIIFLVLGLGCIVMGADYFVKGSIKLAHLLGVSDTIIGLTIVAAGTSLPELVTSLMAALRGERDIAVGNVIGSNIYNILIILGVSSSLTPSLEVAPEFLNFDIPIMIFISLVCLPFFRTNYELSRKEGAVFLLGYFVYTFTLIYWSNSP